MSAEENVELVRLLIDALNASGGSGMMERADEFLDAEIEWIGAAATREAPGGDVVFRGHEGLRRFWAEFDEVWEDLRFSEVRIEALGDDVVVATYLASATGRGSEIRLEQEMGSVYRVRDGRLISGQNFTSHREAEEWARSMAKENVDAQT